MNDVLIISANISNNQIYIQAFLKMRLDTVLYILKKTKSNHFIIVGKIKIYMYET